MFSVSNLGDWGTLAAANKMDYFQLISVLEWSGLPLSAGNDLPIEFDCHPVRFHAEMFDERCHGKPVGQVTLLAIDLQFHGFGRPSPLSSLSERSFSMNLLIAICQLLF
jgi:hypothetical protein